MSINPAYKNATYECTFIWRMSEPYYKALLKAIDKLSKKQRKDKIFLTAWLNLMFPDLSGPLKTWILTYETKPKR